jgi:hypothetical protein
MIREGKVNNIERSLIILSWVLGSIMMMIAPNRGKKIIALSIRLASP